MNLAVGWPAVISPRWSAKPEVICCI